MHLLSLLSFVVLCCNGLYVMSRNQLQVVLACLSGRIRLDLCDNLAMLCIIDHRMIAWRMATP